MTSSKLFRILWISALITLAYTFSPRSTPALFEQPAPYTVDALQRLNSAALRVPPMLAPKGLQQADEESKKKALVRTIYTYWEDLYNEAGYSFEKSLIQLAKDIGADPDLGKNNPQLLQTAFRTTANAYTQLAGINNQGLIVANYLPHPAGEAFAKILLIEEEQRKIAADRTAFESAMRDQQMKKNQEMQAANERKQKEVEGTSRLKAIESEIETERLAQEGRKADQTLRAKEKELAAALNLKRFEGLAGRFVSSFTKKNKPLGELEIKVDATGALLLNGYDNIDDGKENPTPNCQFNDVPLRVKSTSANRTDFLINDAQAPRCEVVLAMSSVGIAIYNTGAAQCPSYCKTRDNFRNNQWRRVSP